MGRTGPLMEPRCGPQAGKSGDPRSQDADNDLYCSGLAKHDDLLTFDPCNIHVTRGNWSCTHQSIRQQEMAGHGRNCVLQVRLLYFYEAKKLFLHHPCRQK